MHVGPERHGRAPLPPHVPVPKLRARGRQVPDLPRSGRLHALPQGLVLLTHYSVTDEPHTRHIL
jgi:hypothetical protein